MHFSFDQYHSLYHKSACTSGSMSRKRILFISGFGAIVSHFVRGDICFYSPCTPEMLEEIRRINDMGFRTDEDLPQWEPALQQTTDADEDIPSCVGIRKNIMSLRSGP